VAGAPSARRRRPPEDKTQIRLINRRASRQVHDGQGLHDHRPTATRDDNEYQRVILEKP
jgi:hypothetical protein